VRSRPLAVLLVLVAGLVAVPSASAAVTASYAATVLTLTSDEAGDQIVVACAANKVLVNGAAPPAPVGELTCDGGKSLGSVVITGNGGDDRIDISGLEADKNIGGSKVDAGPGNDVVTGMGDPDVDTTTLLGGPDDDTLVAHGAELVFGGSGDDRLEGLVPGDGMLDGETGTDTVVVDLSTSPPPATAGLTFTPTTTGLVLSADLISQAVPWASIEVLDLDLNDAPQTVDGRKFSGRLQLRTRDGADTVYGTELGDQIDLGPGNDFAEGLGGADVYLAGSGFDRIQARDGVADSGDCGSDEDVLVADAIDSLVGCERIELVAAPPVAAAPPPPDTKKPALVLRRATLARKLRLAIACPRDELRCTGVLTLTGIGKVGKAKRQVKLGTLSFSLAGGGSKTLALTLGERKRERLDSLADLRLRVRLDISDAAGNRAKRVSTLAL
jgi:Ca2+-binding RTX toxin-like protein